MTKHQSKQYSSYKESGIDLIQKVPESWSVQRVKDVVNKIGNGVTPRGGSEVYQEAGIPFLRSQNVHDEGLELSNVSFISLAIHDEMKNSQLKAGDILFNITGASIGRTCLVPEGLGEANISQHVVFLRIQKQYNKEYISLFLKSRFVKSYIRFEQNGASKEAFTLNKISTIPLVFPKYEEQKAIANYLDEKTANIDEKIALLEGKAEKYSELKQSLINEIITRGLDKTAPMKDSGVAWIGQIPSHWEVKRAKDLFKRMTRNASEADGIITAFRDGQVTLRENRRTSGFTNAIFEHGYQGIRAGDLVIHAMDGFAGAIGVSDSNGKSSPVYQAYIPVDSKKVHNPYYGLLVREMALSGFVSSLGKGIRERSSEFRHKEFAPLKLPVPPIEEQKTIADYLKSKTNHIEKIVETINLEVEKLRELRKTLINDVVTGKIKVTLE